MDSQLLSNLSFWVSVFAATSSFVFALLAWFHSHGSKKARDKAEAAHGAALERRDAAVRSAREAEKRARQAEKSVKQLRRILAEHQKQSESQSEIASHLWRPVFKLEPLITGLYLLHNVTNKPVEVLEVANLDEFVRCPQIQQTFRPGESLRVHLFGGSGMPLPSNLELRVGGRDDVVPVPIPVLPLPKP